MNTFRIPAALSLAALLLAAAGCGPAPSVRESVFGKMPDGTPVPLYTVRNANGMEAAITSYGAIVTSLRVPDRDGKFGDVVLGFDSLSAYVAHNPYFGCVVGRYGNRIARGRFTLDGLTFTLACNNGPNHLHGGPGGFDKKLWSGKPFRAKDQAGVEFTLVSPDGDEGYPGTLRATVRYTLADSNALAIAYTAVTDKPTVVNLTNHSYFDLSAGGSDDILSHELSIDADRFTPVDATLIPTGERRPVEGTPFDFRTAAAIGARIDAAEEQVRIGGGYDHNFILNGEAGVLRKAAEAFDPGSGRAMALYTTEPGVQFYTGNFLDGTLAGKGGRVVPRRGGFCLETQHFPDSPNRPEFPSTALRPGETYTTVTVYRFFTR
jgi:aldose 1-epimerase